MLRVLGIVLLAFGLAQLAFRGMQRVRNDLPLWDFVSVHSATRAWIQGQDPYDLPRVVQVWHQSAIFTDRDVSYFATVYPPSSLLMIAPLALLRAGPAMLAWLALTIALLIAQFAALADLARLSWRDSRSLLLAGAATASAPLQFGILSGQLSLPAISLCILAFCCVARDRQKLAGILLGLACAIKPQLAGPFVLFYILTRRFKVAGFAILIGGILGVAALAAMYLSHIDWIQGWTHSIAITTQTGAVNDYGWTDKFRDEIVDLKMLLVGALYDSPLLGAVTLAIVGLLGLWYLALLPRTARRDPLLALAGFAALILLPIYHRVYDVTLLTLALAWALKQLHRSTPWHRRYALAMFLPMAVFLVPFDITKSLSNRLPFLADASTTDWWQLWIAPHYAWALLVLTLLLLLATSIDAEDPHP